jgi:(1->4)-alpha-D-glucan 1-alpha-D-glucosylmutase
MPESIAFDALCAECGITNEYRDIWGQRQVASHQTRRALLASMSIVAASETQARAALELRREGPWRRRLAPVQVVMAGAESVCVRLNLPDSDAQRWHRWALIEEHGRRHGGSLRPADLRAAANRELDGIRLVRYAFPLPQSPGLGYHRFTLWPVGAQAGEPQSMALIVVPPHCYRPPALADDGRIWGPAVQVYGLRSRRNWGIGDYSDLIRLVDTCADMGADVIGLSPLHSLFPDNPAHASPYSPSSRLFLNPLHLDVEAIAEFDECPQVKDRVDNPAFRERLAALRGQALVDYEGVAREKLAILDALYRHFRARHLSPGSRRAQQFDCYREQAGAALARHALFETIQERCRREDRNGWGWHDWPMRYRDPESTAARAMAEQHRERLEFFQYLQWQAEVQLEAANARCVERGLGVGLCQDLAVGVARDGAETWANQGLYAHDASIGAPADEFNPNGQDWGLPPLLPGRLRENAYGIFIDTLRRNMARGGALRVDHVMGLMRLFWIPRTASPREGTYVHYPFEELLGIVALESQRNRCLVIGEDLGTVPDVVRERLGKSGVLSYRLLYFEKDADGGFRPPAAYPRDAVVAIASHDLSTLAGFWVGQDIRLRTQLGLFASDALRDRYQALRAEDRLELLRALAREGLLPDGMTTEPPPTMSDALALAIHRFLVRAPAAIFMLQPEDLLGQQHQVNLPGTTDEHPNWRRKLTLDLEDWATDPRVRALVRALRDDGRGHKAR